MHVSGPLALLIPLLLLTTSASAQVATEPALRELASLERSVGALRGAVRGADVEQRRLAERVMDGADAGWVRITHQSHIRRLFRLTAVRYVLDGRPLLEGGVEGGPGSSVSVHDGALTPGRHRLSIELTYAAALPGGRTLVARRMTLRAEHRFEVRRGDRLEVLVEAYERTGARSVLESPRLRVQARPLSEL